MKAVEGVVEEVLHKKIMGSLEPVDGHILIFVDSIPHIVELQESLQRLINKMRGLDETDYLILPLHGLLEYQE
jgi:hypothetical protein